MAAGAQGLPIPRIYFTGLQAHRKLPCSRFSPWTGRGYLTWTSIQVILLGKKISLLRITNLNNTLLQGQADSFGAVAGPHFREDIADMKPDCSIAQR